MKITREGIIAFIFGAVLGATLGVAMALPLWPDEQTIGLQNVGPVVVFIGFCSMGLGVWAYLYVTYFKENSED